MKNKSSGILTDSFFSEGGISKNAGFILYMSLLLSLIIWIPAKNRDLLQEIRIEENNIDQIQIEIKQLDARLNDFKKRSSLKRLLNEKGLDLCFPQECGYTSKLIKR